MAGPTRPAVPGRLVALVLGAVVLIAGFVVMGTRGDDAESAGSPAIEECERTVPEDWSIARVWNEALLGAIRLDVPAPTVHARTLFHVSAAMWDAWAAYDPTARGVFLDEDHSPGGDQPDEQAALLAAREEAISFAAYTILVERYLLSAGAEESVTGFDQLMEDLCFDRSYTAVTGDRPAAIGNRIAATILETSKDDGSNESNGYVDDGYRPVNAPLIVAESGADMVDPNRWQPLELDVMVAQNGTPLDETVQTFVGSQWGSVTPFALGRTVDRASVDPGPPPILGDPAGDREFKDAVVAVIEASAGLDPSSGQTIDISPGAIGNVPLGTYEALGHERNPATGEPYEPNVVNAGDYGRVVAEYWADGPSSETPPGHWNALANSVTDARTAADVTEAEALEWDVKLYLPLNGAMHDAAIVAWGAKRDYDYARPISMIRYMGGLGQSSDPDGPAYDDEGLPLVEGLVEVVTEETAAPGERHDGLADHVGEIAIRSWTGAPADAERDVGGVAWILAVDWVPYQLPTFVTPAFAGYVSGHSTFSRAGAEVLAAATGDPFFPGGLGSWTIPAGSLEFESGPTEDVTLQWATYADASNEAGRSRIYGGIHVWADDLRGREVGLEVGQAAWSLALQYFDGTVGE